MKHNQEVLPHAEQLGRCIGYAFQIADDLLDFASESSDGNPLGKPTKKDLVDGRLTVPVQLARLSNDAINEDINTAFTSRVPQDFERVYSRLGEAQVWTVGMQALREAKEKACGMARGMASSDHALENVFNFLDEVIIRRA